MAAAVVLGISACGSDADRQSTDASTAAPVTTAVPASTEPTETVPPDAPPVIHVGDVLTDGVGASPAAGDSIAEGEMTDTKMMAANLEYVFDGPVTDDLATPATAWYFAGPGEPVADETLAALAATLGVEGPVEPIDEDRGGGKIVGPDDFSGPSVTAGVDAMQSWWYSAGGELDVGVCESSTEDTVSDGSDGSDGSEFDECTPAPPAGVPTAAEAEAATTELMTSLGVDPSSFEFETYADEWSSSVNAFLVLDGVRSNVSMYFSFGAEGALTWAGGYFATPQRGEDYPRIGVAAAVERLNEPYWLSGDVLATKAADEPVLESEEPIEGTNPVDTVSGAPVDTATADTGTAGDPVLVDPMPCDPAADCIPADSEPIVIHITNPRPSLEQLWGDDGTVWLLPGYMFDSDDEGVYSVIAVDAAYLVTSDPQPVPEPTIDSVPVPDTAVTPDTAVPPDTAAPDTVSTAPEIEFALVGLTVEEAEKVAEQNGYELRVVREDGADLPVTADFREDRVNVAVIGGMVMEVVNFG